MSLVCSLCLLWIADYVYSHIVSRQMSHELRSQNFSKERTSQNSHKQYEVMQDATNLGSLGKSSKMCYPWSCSWPASVAPLLPNHRITETTQTSWIPTLIRHHRSLCVARHVMARVQQIPAARRPKSHRCRHNVLVGTDERRQSWFETWA